MAVPARVAITLSVLLSLHVFSNVVDHAFADVVVLQDVDRKALLSLYEAWNETVYGGLSASLPGWKSFNINTSYDDPRYVDPCISDSWRGVFCSIELNETASVNESIYNAGVVGLEVSGTLIRGTLPGSLWSFQRLVTVVITGNSYLIGSIPRAPVSVPNAYRFSLKRLDLHDNGFMGYIPDQLLKYYERIEDLDLSNNQLAGPVPESLALNNRLKTLNLSRNSLSGRVPWNIAQNWTDLLFADFSNNNFDGPLPNLISIKSLFSLTVSHNEFGGEIDLSIFSPKAKESIVTLDFSNNHFMGALPNFTGWSKLLLLNLSGNDFSPSPFPSWLSSLHNLSVL